MTVEDRLKMLEQTGKIETLGMDRPGLIIDLYNQRVEKRREKDFSGKVQAMNRFYIKLIIQTMEQKQAGIKNPIYKSNSILL